MGRTPFYRTLNELEHHFSNIKQTRTCSSYGYRTRTPYFWLWTIKHRTSNIVRRITKIMCLLKNFLLFRKRIDVPWSIWSRKSISIDISSKIPTNGSAWRSEYTCHHQRQEKPCSCVLLVVVKIQDSQNRQCHRKASRMDQCWRSTGNY